MFYLFIYDVSEVHSGYNALWLWMNLALRRLLFYRAPVWLIRLG